MKTPPTINRPLYTIITHRSSCFLLLAPLLLLAQPDEAKQPYQDASQAMSQEVAQKAHKESTKSQHDQGSSSLETKMLAEQVVTASGFHQSHLLAPASISVVSPQDIASRPVRDLAEALANVPGVSIDASVSKTGGYGISIRGMPSSYTLVLIDGKRVNADSSLFPNGFGDSTTSFMPPLSMIEKIEVVRGPASTLYGSDAIGGVVNIITKQRYDKWGASFGYDYTFQENKSFGNTQGFNFYTAGPLNEAKNWGLSLRGRQYNREFVPSTNLSKYPSVSNGQESQATAGRNTIVGLAPFSSYNVGGRLSWSELAEVGGKPRNSAYLDIDYSQQNYDNSQGLLGTYKADGTGSEQDKQAANGYGSEMDFYRLNVVAAHKGHYRDSLESTFQTFSTDSSLQYNFTANPNRYVPKAAAAAPTNGVSAGDSRELESQDIIIDHKSNAFFAFGDHMGLNASLGGRYWYNTFRDKIFQVGGKSATQDQHIGAIFGEGELGVYDRLFLTAGIRGNFNSIFGGNASPRVYLSYNAIKRGWLAFKGGISTGYKTPALPNLINGIANLSGQGSTHTYGNPNLKPESSINYELSALSDNPYFSASITGFYTNFTDRISTTPSVSQGQVINGFTCGASSCSSYVNVDEAISYGAETSLAIKPISVGYGTIGLNAAYTFTLTEITKSQDKKAIGTRLQNVPLHNFTASINYDSRHFGAYIRQEYKAGIYRGDPNIAGTAAATLGAYYKPIALTHLGAYYRVSDRLRINAAVYNLFNVNFVDYQRYTTTSALNYNYANAYNYIREGRRYYISVQMDF